ncbi:protein NRT1/ PTR FAMILY 5.4-like isoform X2 [Manihot esculenta]|uniref:protein NRT1/ PTR FAMILY 5.4-like isoform X2 n=1 Tax=Manihot esculenta TaxID=3983 RepID=UPI001CC74717|nr:protein NRT1/ PTR FAMILY 5.4-like isoform X2 [Manihot esculenta]
MEIKQNTKREKNNGFFLLVNCLDKAAIPETSFPDQERQQGKLCTIEEVNRVKKLLGLLPMWTTLLIYALVEATGSTFFIEQVDSLNAIKLFGFKLPINAFSALESLTRGTKETSSEHCTRVNQVRPESARVLQVQCAGESSRVQEEKE